MGAPAAPLRASRRRDRAEPACGPAPPDPVAAVPIVESDQVVDTDRPAGERDDDRRRLSPTETRSDKRPAARRDRADPEKISPAAAPPQSGWQAFATAPSAAAAKVTLTSSTLRRPALLVPDRRAVKSADAASCASHAPPTRVPEPPPPTAPVVLPRPQADWQPAPLPASAVQARAEPMPSAARSAATDALRTGAADAARPRPARPERQGADAAEPAGDRAHNDPRAARPGARALQPSPTGEATARGEEPEVSSLEAEFPPEIERLEPMEPLAAPSFAPLWPIPVTLSGDVFALREARAGGTAAGSRAQDKKEGEAPRAEDDPEHQREADDLAQAEAARAYAALVDSSRQLQQTFVNHAAQVAAAMVRAAEQAGSELERHHGSALANLDLAADRARQDVEAAAAEAEMMLEDAFRAANLGLTRASRRAHGAISANERNADAQINAILASLVGGHRKAYDDGIAKATKAATDAVAKLQAWSNDRNTIYPTEGQPPLLAAQNESVRQRVQAISPDVQRQVNERKTNIVRSWSSSRDSCVCGLECQFRPELDKHKAAMHRQGHRAVSRALRTARDTLERQHRDGKQALTNLRTSARTQIETQRNNARSRLTGQARASIEGVSGESRAALDGIGQATRASLPSYWRGVQGFEQSIRRAGRSGPPAVRKTSRDGAKPIERNLDIGNRRLTQHFDDNQRRLETALERRTDGFAEHSRALLLETGDALRQRTLDTITALGQSGRDAAAGFEGHDRAVTQSAESWARPISQAMAGYISQSRASAQQSLNALLTGAQPPSPAPTTPSSGSAAAAVAQAGQEQPAGACGGCPSTVEGGPAAATLSPAQPPGGITVTTAAPGASAAPKGLTEQINDEEKFSNDRAAPTTFPAFVNELVQVRSRVEGNLSRRSEDVTGGLEAGIIDRVDEGKVTGALRGLTQLKGHALDVDVYPGKHNGRTLSNDLLLRMGGGTDYQAAVAYLSGNAVEGARLELQASMHWYNDEEARIEATMRALSPEQIRALGASHAGILDEIHDALDSTDRQVFDALRQADPAHATDAYAQADAIRLRARIDELRRDGEHDAVHAAIVEYTAATEEGYGGMEVSAEERRTAVVGALGNLVSDADVAYAAGSGGVAAMTAEERAVAYVIRDIEMQVGGGHDYPPQTITLRMGGANRDLARDLLLHGEGSVEARASRLGVELQRSGDAPNSLNIDRAMFDERFTPDNPKASQEEREANEARRREARADRAQVLMLAAQRYAGEQPPPEGTTVTADQALRDPRVVSARDALISRLETRYGDDTLGGQLAQGLLTDERPSPATAAIAMRHAMYSRTGTDEELLFRFTERMNRDEIAEMREKFAEQTGGRSLDAELGVYGEGGWFTELSGDDRLRMERAMLGVARTDQERLEVAAFAIDQQRQETGRFGRWLASGSLAEEAMNATYHRLITSAGGNLRFDRRGHLITPAAFDARGNYTGTDRATFIAAADAAQQVAQNYSARIDAYANLATTGIMILGAVAGAVITAATGGAAGPLVAAALITGFASMAAQYALKGGRYGWEQAAVDLGMTAVQALTAGVGAQLGLAAQAASKGAQAASQASRVVTTLARMFTGNRVLDQIIIGAITGGIGGLGMAALNEPTWARGAEGGIDGLIEGLLKGMLAGAATSAVTNSIESIGIRGQQLGDRLQALSAQGPAGRATLNMLMRGGARSIISATGGMSGRSVEMLFDAASGRFRGDSGDALVLVAEAGLQSAVQGFGEGMGEAHGKRIHDRREAIRQARAAAGRPPPAATEAAPTEVLPAAAEGVAGTLRPAEAEGAPRPVAAEAEAAGAPRPPVEPVQRPLSNAEAAATLAIRAASSGEPPSSTARPPAPNEAAETATRIAEAFGAAPVVRAGGAEPPGGGRGRGGNGGEGGGSRPQPPEDDRLFPNLTDAEIDAAFGDLAAGPLVRAPAEELGLRWPATQGGYWGVEPATGMTVQEYRFLATRGMPPLDPAGNPVAGPRRNVMTRMRIHSPDPTAPPGSVSRERWTVSFEQGNARMTADGRWFDTRYGETPDGRRIDVRPYERGPLGDWVERGTSRPVTDPDVRAAIESWDRNMAASHIPLHPGEPPAGGAPPPPQSGGPSPPRLGGLPGGEDGGPADRAPTSPQAPAAPHPPAAEVALPRVRVAAEEAAPPRIRVAAGEPEAQRRRIATHEEAKSAGLAEVEAAATAPRRMTIEGAAATISGSRMRLADHTVITNPPSALGAALGEIVGRIASIGDAALVLSPEGPMLRMTGADGEPLRVRVVVGETSGSDVANFRRAGAGDEGFDYIVTLSPRAPADAHARALAHELAEVRMRGRSATATPDVLRAAGPPRPEAGLSAHDAGRLAELEVLAQRLQAAVGDPVAQRRIRADIDALAAHLGLLHVDAADPRLTLAHAALPEDSPARAVLAEARVNAGQRSADDLLTPAGVVRPGADLSAADLRQVTAFEELAARFTVIDAEGGRRLVVDPTEHFRVARGLEDLAGQMGLLGTDAASQARAQRLTEILGPDTPATRALASVRRAARQEGANDALRPGVDPTNRNLVLSERDRQKLGRLQEMLEALPPRPAPGIAEPPETARLRHEAEALAAELGLVFGQQHASKRTSLAAGGLSGDETVMARLTEVREGANGNPLLVPRTGTAEDLPLLARQIERARSMGDDALAAQLSQIAGRHLADARSEGFSQDPEAHRTALRALSFAREPEQRAVLADARERHAQAQEATRLRGEAAAMRDRLVRMRRETPEQLVERLFDPEAGQPTSRKQRQMEALEARARQLEAQADGLERVALRPGDMSPEDALRLPNDDPRITAARNRVAQPDFFGNRTQQILTRQLYADSPQFQEWQRFVQLYYDLHPSLGGRGTMRFAKEGWTAETLRDRLLRQAQLALEFTRARFVAEETGRTRALGDLPFIEAGRGRSVPFVEPTTGAAVRLAASDVVLLPDGSTIPVAAATARRSTLLNEIKTLKAANPANKAAIREREQEVRALSEGLGEAAGLRWARAEFGNTGTLTADRGSGATDILHIDTTTGRVTVIECKGGMSPLGSREAEVGSRAVRAEQTTPEYLRSLANEMIQRGRTIEGEAILRALDQTPPNIEAIVVRQPFNEHGQPLPIQVTRYEVPRSGR